MAESAVGAGHLYKDEVLEIEPHGLEHITQAQRHGRPFQMFTLWMAANLVLATWVIGNLAVGTFGVSMLGAFVALAIGNVLGALLLGLLSTFGPRLGVPQMIQSRAPFGLLGNFGPAGLNYLAGIGWFAVNTVYGTFALAELAHLNYFLSLAIMVVGQVALAVYGHNMIHAFERWMSVALIIVFVILAFFTFKAGNYGLAFNPKAPVPFGGPTGGFIITIGLALSYAMGWMPFASDYSRYLPSKTKPSSIVWWTALGMFIPCLILEWMGALTVSVAMPAATAANPANAIAFLMPGPLAKVALLAIAVGTACANALNIYSGSMSALVVKVERSPWLRAGIAGVIFGAVTAIMLVVANSTLATDKESLIAVPEVVGAAVLVGLVVAAAVRFRFRRWQAAVVVGVLGGLLATGGSNATQAASQYSNFLLLLSYWIGPWVAVVLVDWFFKHRGSYELRALYDQTSTVRVGTIAWLIGLGVSVPFMNQSWFVGPIPSAYPQLGDVSYLVSFVVAGSIFALFGRPHAGPVGEARIEVTGEVTTSSEPVLATELGYASQEV
ncbi:MAG TPA: cytosine permease [Candidatus Dormibacteraeota bacterium]|nr:cytosine permease [Candidatus Dormibacteraeota bacterium]